MTICLAAAGKKNEQAYIVAASDKMLTNNIIGGSFEHPSPKYKILNKKYVAMLSGNPLLFSELMPSAVPKEADIFDIASQIKDKFKQMRLNRINEEILGPLYVNKDFLGTIIGQEVPNQYVDSVIDAVSKFRLDTDILLAGVENNRGVVLQVSETGIHNFDEIGFHGIGSGYVEAINTLLFQEQHQYTALRETVYNVFKAKKNAEVSDGVGRWTDMIVLDEEGHKELSHNDLKLLNKIYEKELKFGKNHNLLNSVMNGGL